MQELRQRAKDFASKPFGSAVLGGAVVGIFGWFAIAAGWIEGGEETAPLTAAPLTRPVSDSNGKALTVNEIYERDSEGVAFIQAEVTQNVQSPFDVFPQQQQSTASGSGFVIDEEGHILTNNHVVEGAQSIQVKIGDGEALDATLVGSDPSSDVAVLKIEGDAGDLEPLELAPSESAKVGDPVVAIGNPFGLDRTVTSGIVSALQREINAPNGFSISDVIQTDAPINPGNSGGPLLDASGRVIGINSQIETGGTSNGSVGIGFAVPIDTARDVVNQLLTTGEVKRGYLGIQGADGEDGGAEIQPQPGGPAEEAGLEGGDVIFEIDGEPVEGIEDVIATVNEGKPGDELTLEIERDGERQEVKAKLGERPDEVTDAGAPTPVP